MHDDELTPEDCDRLRELGAPAELLEPGRGAELQLWLEAKSEDLRRQGEAHMRHADALAAVLELPPAERAQIALLPPPPHGASPLYVAVHGCFHELLQHGAFKVSQLVALVRERHPDLEELRGLDHDAARKRVLTIAETIMAR